MSASIHGFAEPRFQRLADTFEHNIASGEELGAAVYVDIDGKPLVDLWGGYADVARTRPWERDTIVNVWSCTKTVSALAVLVLVERGLLDVNTAVAEYWPEFGAAGKAAIEVRHVLGHTSGLSGWDGPWNAPDDLYDLDRATSRLASQAPWWEPGTATGYHAFTQGHIISELVRRVSGMTLTEFVRDELAGPLNCDFQIGAIPSDDHRIAEVVPPPPLPFDINDLDPDSIMVKTFLTGVMDASVANSPEWRAAEIGAGNGHGNARSLARLLSVVSRRGEIDGHRLLGPGTIELIFAEQARGIDLVTGVPTRRGMGFGLPEPDLIPSIPEEKIAFWGGWGGSMIIVQPERGLTISYVMNRMAPGVIGSDRADAYLTAVYDALA